MYQKEEALRERTGTTERYVALCLWLGITLVYFSVASQWITFSTYDKQFTEYVQHVIQGAASDHRPSREIRTLLLVKAEELSIPLPRNRIDITGEGDTLRTVIRYDTEIKVPLLNRVVYRMEFNHELTQKVPR